MVHRSVTDLKAIAAVAVLKTMSAVNDLKEISTVMRYHVMLDGMENLGQRAIEAAE